MSHEWTRWLLEPTCSALPWNAGMPSVPGISALLAAVAISLFLLAARRARPGRASRRGPAAAGEAARRDSEAPLRQVLRMRVTEAIYLLDPSGSVESMNVTAEAMQGYAFAEAAGRNVSTFFAPEDVASGAFARILSAARDDGRFSTEAWQVRRDGSRFRAAIAVDAIRREDGSLHGFAMAARDLTDERSALAGPSRQAREAAAMPALLCEVTGARDAAERANRAKSRFLASMSHELRTPLNGILGYAHLLRAEGGLSPTQSARVAAMLDAGKHLLEMITGILDLSKIEAQEPESCAVAMDLRAVAADCLGIVRPMADAKGLALSFGIAPGTRQNLLGDPRRLRQILLNLLGNAVKFTAEGTISLWFRDLPGSVTLRIEVADTGPGIAAGQRQRLFQDFERLHADCVGAVEGAGLGLALSARLAAAMGGRLGHDDNPGGGSVFWLELPLDAALPARPGPARSLDAPAAESAPAPATATATATARKLRVLVVDDVLMNRDIAASFLTAAGHVTTCVAGGAEALAAAATLDFDVVLMDVLMPEMDGLEATRRIRALAGPRGRVPIVGLTAQAFSDQVATCRLAGMDGHLAKPFDPDALLAVVADAAVREQAAPADTGTVPATRTDAPVFDRSVYERTASFLSPDAVATYMQVIADGCETLLADLHDPDAIAAPGHDLARAAHILAGSAGLFGFKRVASLGRRFERALHARSPEAAGLVPEFRTALADAIETIQSLIGAGPSLRASSLMIPAVAGD